MREAFIASMVLMLLATASALWADEPDVTKNNASFIVDTFSLNDHSRPKIDLSGEWEFRKEGDSDALHEGWPEGKGTFSQKITIPGVPQSQGLGSSNGSLKYNLDEPFWVRRTFRAPSIGAHKRVWLRLGGVLPAAQVYLNGHYIGYTKSSRTQQRVDVSPYIQPQQINMIAIKVCAWPKVKLEGIWEMAETRIAWTGVYRPVFLEIANDVSLIDAHVVPKLASNSASVNLELIQPAAETIHVVLKALDGKREIGSASVVIPSGKKTAIVNVALHDFSTWSPEHPNLYNMTISLADTHGELDKDKVTFGMREIATIGKKFYLNGKPIFIKAFGDDQLYSETVAPPADKSWYLKRLKLAREYGFNAAKSCEETFNQDYIEAADEAGIMIIQEMPFGLSGYVRLHQQELEKPWRDFYGAELDGLVMQTRNNPSVIAYSMCSEVPFDGGTQEAFDFFCRQCTARAKELAPNCLAIDCTGSSGDTNTPKGKRITDFYALMTWKEALDEPELGTDGRRPAVLHEYNWWSCYPDPQKKSNYSSSPLIPWWLDALSKTAKENGQSDLIETYVKNSAYIQAICRKDGIEYARRAANVEGFICWLITDYGQYSEGVLDDFWNPKSISAEEFRKCNGETVILLAKEGDRCFAAGGSLRIPLAISNYGEADLSGSVVRWTAVGGPLSTSGEISIRTLPSGEFTKIGDAAVRLPAHSTGYKFELTVSLEKGGKVINTNNWLFWALPEARKSLVEAALTHGSESGVSFRSSHSEIPDTTSLVVADSVDPKLADYVNEGGKCILFGRPSGADQPDGRYNMFRTIPWNGGTGNSGTVIADHPALAGFPHDTVCDFQFASLIKGFYPMSFESLRKFGVWPIIRDIDFYQTNKNLAYMLEFSVGKGKVIVTSLGVMQRLKEKLEARSLLSALIDYAEGPAFAPSAHLTREDFIEIFEQKLEKK